MILKPNEKCKNKEIKKKEYNPEGTHNRIIKIAEIKEIAAQKKRRKRQTKGTCQK